MITMNLSKPITDEGKTISTLTFREPTGNDLIDCGMPWRYELTDNGKTVRTINTPAIGMLISKLADVDHSFPHLMNARDFMMASIHVQNFFTDVAEPSSS